MARRTAVGLMVTLLLVLASAAARPIALDAAAVPIRRAVTTPQVESNQVVCNITEQAQYAAPWTAFPSDSAAGNDQLAAYQFISGQLETGLTDVRSVYATSYSLAASWGALINSQQAVWYAGWSGAATAACAEACWTAATEQLTLELSYLQMLDEYETLYDALMNEYFQDLGSYIAAAGNLVEIDADNELPPPPKHSNWFSVAMDVFSGVAALSAVVFPEVAPLNLFLGVVVGTGDFVEASQDANVDTTSTAGVDWYVDNSSTELVLSNLEIDMPQTFASMKDVCGNQMAAIAGDWGRLQAFWTLVAMAGAIPSQGQLEQLLDQLQPQMEFSAFSWVLPSKYEVVLEDDYGHTGPDCDKSDVVGTGNYRSAKGETVNYLGSCPSSTSKCGAAADCGGVHQTNGCTQQRFAWLGEIGHSFSMPQQVFYDTINNDCGPYMQTMYGASDILDVLLNDDTMWAANYEVSSAGVSTNGWSIDVTYYKACHLHNSGKNHWCDIKEPCQATPAKP